MTDLSLKGIESVDWISTLPRFAEDTIKALLASGLSEEQVASVWLSRAGSPNTAPFGTIPGETVYLEKVKVEFSKVICGDPKYNDIRDKISAQWENSKTSIISFIALGIAASVGLAVATLTPIVAILLSIVARVGLNAWCST